jgi:putative Holliday junction resolvase
MFPKTLAIDVGTKKIGLALSYATLAQPFRIIANTQSVVQEIQDICQEEQVEQILVGISEGKSAQLARDFAALLQSSINLPLTMTDETLTTQEAIEKIQQVKGKLSRMDDDHIAAAIFLQEWIDSNGEMS